MLCTIFIHSFVEFILEDGKLVSDGILSHKNPTSVNLRTVNRITFPTNVNLGAGHRRKTVDVGFGKDWWRV